MKLKNKLVLCSLSMSLLIPNIILPAYSDNVKKTTDQKETKKAPVSAEPKKTAKDYLTEGIELYNQHSKDQYEQSIVMFDKAMELDRDFVEARAAKAAAQVFLSYSLSLRRKNTKNLNLQTSLLLDSFNNAFIAAKQDPESVLAHSVLSMVYFLQKRYPEGRDEANIALKINDKYSLAHFTLWLNSIQFKKDQNIWIYPDDAELEKSIDLDDTFLMAYIAKANLLIQWGNLNDAEKYLKRALNYAPKNEEALNILGFLYYQKRNMVSAQNTLEESLAINPENADTHSLLGMVYFNKWDMSNANFHYEKACELADEEACRWLSRNGQKGIVPGSNN